MSVLENNRTLEPQEVIDYLLTIPEGKLTTVERICTVLGGKLPIMLYWRRQITDELWVPYWRVVSEKGRLLKDFGMEPEVRRRRLVSEGVPLKRLGNGVWAVVGADERWFE